MPPPIERSAAARPVYQTDLSQTPLPEILVTIHRYKAPGTIECRRGSEVKEIFLDAGNIIFAASNQVRDSLGDRLLNEGHITRDQYEESVRRLVATGKRQGAILTEMRVVSAEVMLEVLRGQIQDILWSIFGWEAGSVSFTPGREKHQEFVKICIPIPQALIEGVRHIADMKPLMARMGSKATILARTQVASDLALDEDEAALLAAVDGKRVLFELVNLPPLAPGVNARLLYAFATLGLIAEKPDGRIKVQVRSAR